MSDIVERLREAAANLSEIYPDYAEAADEITRLRAELATVTAERDRLLNNNDKMLVQIEKLVEENNEWHSAANWPDKSPRALRLESANLWKKNKELRAENESLREALKPFEAELQAQEEEVPHVTEEEVVFYNYSLCLRHLRRARAALEGATK